jgi:hypothetical protein
MTKPIITEHNSTTGEYIQREMTDYEWEQTQLVEARDAAKAAENAAKAAAKQALLARLGITEEEAALLLGGTN